MKFISYLDNPEIVAKRFNFVDGMGHDEINTSISHVCLGELRDLVSHMTMQECIEQRRTTLTESVASTLRQVVHAQTSKKGWGIELEVVQVSQVFIVDDDIRRQLDAEVRNQLKSTSVLSDIHTQEEIQLAQSSSARRFQQEQLDAEREQLNIQQEKLRLKKALEQEAIEVETPVQLLEIEKRHEVLIQKIKMQRLENQVQELELQRELMKEKARHELRKEILPLEQMPEIAKAVSQMFQGTNLTFYGEASPLVSSLAPVIDMLSNAFSGVGVGTMEKK
jgi:CRISPR/Cas system-associated protein Cas5 (RAMP superfamily)